MWGYRSIDDVGRPSENLLRRPQREPKSHQKIASGLFALGILCAAAIVGGYGLINVKRTTQFDVPTLSKETVLSDARDLSNSNTLANPNFSQKITDSHRQSKPIESSHFSNSNNGKYTKQTSGRNQHISKHQTELQTEVIDDGSLQMNVTTSGYPSLQSTSPSISGYPWKYIVEPFKVSVFQVDGPTSTREEGEYYTWEITEHNGKVTSLKGEIMFFVFRDVTKKSMVTVRQYDSNNELKAIHTEEVICKYVRREIRELLPADLKLLMDTMSIIWDTSSEDGRALYGDRFQGIDFFNMKHITQGADPECNHFHEGPGFITQHLALTLEFEQALQSVDPSISMPYWDFTVDAELYGPDWSLLTPVLADDVMGPGLSPVYTVNRGRWAYTSLGDYGTYFNKTSIHNSYGLLRPPWNNNPYPYLTRWHNIAGTDRTDMYPNDCSDYWETMHDQTWTDFALDANTKAHGFLHGLLGGVWYEYKDWYADGLLMPVGSGLTYVKYFWRAGFIDCPAYCAPDTPRSECRCHCNYHGKSWTEVLDDVQDLLKETIYKDLITRIYYKCAEYPEGFESTDDYVQYLFEGIVCDAGSIGDNFDSESTHDPTFWPMHPTFERLMHWMRLSPEPYEYNWGVDVYSCVGHNPQDPIPFRNLFVDDDPAAGDYTNEQLYNKLDPTSETVPYVYSNFEWTHCEAMGFDMSNENLRSDTEQLKRYSRPMDRTWEYSTIDWGLPWAEQSYLEPPSVISARLRNEAKMNKNTAH
jgi:hypothetical protein